MREKVLIAPTVAKQAVNGTFFAPLEKPFVAETADRTLQKDDAPGTTETAVPALISGSAPGSPLLPPHAPSSPPVFSLGSDTHNIDWFAMGQPYFNRGVPQLRLDRNSGIEQQWMIGFNFARSLGFNQERSAWLSNQLTPAAIDFNLANDYPTRWEVMSREMNVSPLMLPIPALHFKLQVNQPNDAAEQEADAVAEKVMSGETVTESNVFFKPAAKPVQREAANIVADPQVTAQVNDVLQQPGQPMPTALQAEMGKRFGHDFSAVKVHTDSKAGEASGALQAKAFTSGSNIVFGEGYYQPETQEGRRLLAHELTHVVQQNESIQKKATRHLPVLPAVDQRNRQDPEQSEGGHAEKSAARMSDPNGVIPQVQTKPVSDRFNASSVNWNKGLVQRKEQPDTSLDDRQQQDTSQPTPTGSTKIALPVTFSPSPDSIPSNAVRTYPVQDVTEFPQPASAETQTGHEERAEPSNENSAEKESQGHSAKSSVQQKEKSAVPVQPAKGNQQAGKLLQPPEPVVTANPGDLLAVLQQTPASNMGQAFHQISDLSKQSLELKKNDENARMPKVPEKDGSAYGGNIKGLKTRHTAKSKEAAVPETAPVSKEQNQIVETVEVPPALPARPNTNAVLAASDENVAAKATEELENLELDTSFVPDQMEPPPPVDLSGDADPGNIDQECDEQSTDVSRQREEYAKEVENDFGENDVIPKPAPTRIVANKKLRTASLAKQKADNPGDVPGYTGQLDLALGPVVSRKIGEQKAIQDEEELKYHEETAAAYQQADDEIGEASLKARQEQFDTSNKVQEDVNNSRKEWREELTATEETFKTDASKASADNRKKIADEEQKGNDQIARHQKDAEKEMADEKKKAEDKARREKENKKKESRGFWGWLKDKAVSLINAIKDLFNAILNALRKAVQWILNRLKDLVQGIIDLVKNIVVGIIKAFGAILKGLVDIAFAAFPEIRDRINAKIDGAVNKAVEITTQSFDAFKKAVGAIIDFVADLVDKLLLIFQKVWSAVLTVISMLINGELKEIFTRMGYLVDAMGGVSFETIKQGGIEELMGGNLDEPLSAKELMAAADMGLMPSAANGGQESALPQALWTGDKIGVDAVSTEELSPEIRQELVVMAQTGTEELEIGADNHPSRTMDAVLKEAAGESKAAEVPQEKVNDGLSPMQRADIKWGMMKAGLTKWWDENWLYVVGGVIGALIAFVAAEILTGGAITAALPVILPILEYVFAGIAIAQFGGYFVEFLEKSWNGDVKGGTKALSRGIGAALIELALYLGFGALKVVGKAAKAVAKGAVAIGKQIGKAIIRGLKFIIEKGKVLFKGIAGSGLGKLAKSLRKFGEKLLEHTRFRKFRIRLRGTHFLLEAFINPWVLIAEGDLVEVEHTAGKTVGQQGKFMTAAGEEVEGFLVTAGKEKNAFTEAIKDGRQTFEKLAALEDDAARNARIFGGSPFDYEKAVKAFGKDVADAMKRTDDLAKALGPKPSPLHQAHHVMPVELLEKNPVLRKAVEGGFKFNGKGNGKWLKQFSSKVEELMSGVHASHPNYTQRVAGLIDQELTTLGKSAANLTNQEAKNVIEAVVERVGSTIDKFPNTKIDDLVF